MEIGKRRLSPAWGRKVFLEEVVHKSELVV